MGRMKNKLIDERELNGAGFVIAEYDSAEAKAVYGGDEVMKLPKLLRFIFLYGGGARKHRKKTNAKR